MIVLDTNVLSELMRPEPAESVLHWMAGQPGSVLYVTTLSYAEILLGIGLMANGQRRRRFAEQAESMFSEEFAGRVLSFDPSAAPAYAAIASQRQRAGNRINAIDGMIAAIAQVHGAAVASRDNDLAGCGVPLINPWAA